MAESCKSCKFCKSAIGGDGRTMLQVCRRNPPTPIAVPVSTPQGVTMGLQAVCPPVDPNDWCGEYQAAIKLAI